MRQVHVTGFALLMLSVSCTKYNADGTAIQQGSTPVDVATVRQKIEAGNAGVIAALQKGDSIAAASFYDDSAMVMPSEMAAAVGHAQIVSTFGGLSTMFTVSNMKLMVGDVVASGDLASETGRFEWTLTPKAKGGKPMTEKGKYVVVWKKQADGSYKLFRDIWNADAPAAPAK